MKPKSEDLNSFLSSSDHRGKVLIEDDGENGRGKGRVGKIIHGPAEDLSLFDRHALTSFKKNPPSSPFAKGERGGLYAMLHALCSMQVQTVLISCRIKKR